MGRIISTESLGIEEQKSEYNLRPQYLSEYIGQKKVKDNLHIFIEAAKKRNEPLDHLLLYGPPGLGKTTLSTIVANEMGVNIKITSGPAIEKPGELAAILNNLSDNDILFIDEIHRLSTQVEEVLYPAMEDYAIDVVIGKGAGARSIRLDLPRFTLIGATTRVMDNENAVIAVEDVDLLDVVESVCDDVEYICKKNLKFTYDLKPTMVKANMNHIVIVVNNLMSNAVKYSNDGGNIHVSCGVKNDSYFISVRDEGRGMDKSTKEKIFESFYRGEPDRSAEGFGLGLSQVMQIARYYGGIVDVDSEPGKGSLFTFKIPVNAE